MNHKTRLIAAGVAGLMLLGGCSAADVASRNISTEADSFRVDRRITFINLITGDYLLTITGKCALGNADDVGELTVTCKVAEDAYTKQFLGITAGANVTYVVEQLETSNVSDYSYELLFRPEVVLPTVVR